MTGENPYAPPNVSEPESVLICSGDGWKLLDDILLVRIGGTLPMVDLETGFSDTSLQPYRLPHAVFRFTNSFWSYAEPRRAFYYRIRYFIREICFWPLFLMLMFVPDDIFPSFPKQLSGFKWLAIFLPYLVWGWLDRSKLKIEDSAKPGWLRVTNFHPRALAYLREMADKKNLRYYPNPQ
jgi:hypothetical protein